MSAYYQTVCVKISPSLGHVQASYKLTALVFITFPQRDCLCIFFVIFCVFCCSHLSSSLLAIHCRGHSLLARGSKRRERQRKTRLRSISLRGPVVIYRIRLVWCFMLDVSCIISQLTRNCLRPYHPGLISFLCVSFFVVTSLPCSGTCVCPCVRPFP